MLTTGFPLASPTTHRQNQMENQVPKKNTRNLSKNKLINQRRWAEIGFTQTGRFPFWYTFLANHTK